MSIQQYIAMHPLEIQLAGTKYQYSNENKRHIGMIPLWNMSKLQSECGKAQRNIFSMV